MLRLIWVSIIRQPQRALLLGTGLACMTAGILLVAALSSSNVVQVEKSLSKYWRTTYDILVRPSGTRSNIETENSLVEANYLLGIDGGISFEQYDAIRSIPGVEIAAPLAVLGYIPLNFDDTLLVAPGETGVYKYETSLEIKRGSSTLQTSSSRYGYQGPGEYGPSGQADPRLYPHALSRFQLSHPSVDLLMVAIDPDQEAALVGLDRAVKTGSYFTGEEKFSVSEMTGPGGQPVRQLLNVPVLLNQTPYVDFSSTIRMERIEVPQEISSFKDLMNLGGARYLDTLPVEQVIAEDTIDSQTAYQHMVSALLHPEDSPDRVVYYSLPDYKSPFSREYRRLVPPFSYAGLVIEALPMENRWGDSSLTAGTNFTIRGIGAFDGDSIPKPEDINRVPLETYFPPTATLRYTADGQSVPPEKVLPTLLPEHSVPSPPMIITNLEAARAIAGKESISAVRVRVAGIEGLSTEAQQKIEAIATEIRRRTGLDVDIMVGSSPTAVLVKEPDLGYVEENWIQKNLVFDYRRKIQSGHIFILFAIAVVGAVFVLDISWVDVLANQQVFAIQKALGWYEKTLVAQICGRVTLIGLLATGLGIIAGYGLAILTHTQLPTPGMAGGVAALGVSLSLAGSLIPAYRASKISPVQYLRPLPAARISPAGGRLRGLSQYILQEILRNWKRTGLVFLSAALSSILLSLFLLITVNERGYLSGSLLGQYIAGDIAGYHYGLVAVAFGLTVMSIGNSLVAEIYRRRKEIGLLKAVGWDTREILSIFLGEGLVFGMIGGGLGTLLSAAAYVYLYQYVPGSILWIAPLCLLITLGISVAGALYPARLAARLSAAEALRFE